MLAARHAVPLAALCAVLCAPPDASALTEYQRNKLLVHLDHAAMAEDTRFFDGAQFVAGVPFPEIKRYMGGYVDKLNRAIREWNMLSKRDLGQPDVQPIRKKLQAKIAWGQAMQKVYPALEAAYNERVAAEQAAASEAKAHADAATAAADALCREFRKEVMTNKRMYSMMGLLGRAGHLSGASKGSLADIRERAKTVAAACAQPKYADVGKGGCDWLKRPAGRAQWDPEEWCAIAPKWQEIALGWARADIEKELTSFDHRPLVSNKLEGSQSLTFFARCVPNSEGWTDVERYDACTLSEEMRAKFTAKYAQKFIDIEVEPETDDTTLAPLDNAFAEARRLIDEKAPTWRSPTKDGSDYSVGLAKKQLRKWIKGARWKKGYLSRATWKISKNALGIPLRRTKPGYVLYQVPGERWCQIRSYTLTEEYSGGGTYQKAGGVRFGYQRFQKCGN